MVANPQWVSEDFRVALGVSYATSRSFICGTLKNAGPFADFILLRAIRALEHFGSSEEVS